MLICLNIFLIFMIGSLSIDSKFLIDGLCVMAFAPTAKTMSRAPSSEFDVVNERLVFCGFSIEGFCS